MRKQQEERQKKKMRRKKRREYPWDIHYITDTGKHGMIDAHTHGLNDFNSPELQFVLSYPASIVGGILNEIGEMIRNGQEFSDGDIIRGISYLTCDIMLKQTTDVYGAPVLRIIIPDGSFRWPEDSDEYPYCEQYKSPYASKKN